MMKRRTLTAMIAIGIAISQSGAAIAREQAQGETLVAAPVMLHITAQSMETALREFGRQLNLQVVYPTEVVGTTLMAPGLSGRYDSASSALDKLLEGSGLSYRFINAETIAIRLANPTAGTAGIEGLHLVQSGEVNSMQAISADEAGQQGEEQKNTTPEGRDSIDEILVTAQKREERLQDVPMSMSVLGGDELDRSTAQGVGEMLNRVPGVVFDTAIGSLSGGANLAMRGVTAPTSYVAGPSPVAYYMDSMPFALVRSSIVPDAQPYDLERVEVLRGPQGTLYGASAQAGVVRVLTKEADVDAWEFKARGLFSQTEHGGGNGGLDAAVNVPLVNEKLAARAVVSYKDLSGWIDKASRPDVNDLEQLDARLKILAKPTENLSLGLSAWRSRADNDGFPVATDGQGQFSSWPDVESLAADFDTYGLTVGYDFPSFSLASTSSYLDYVSYSGFRQAPSGSRTLVNVEMSAKIFAQEFNLTSTTEGPWRWTAGAMYRDGEDRQFLDFYAFTYPSSVMYTSESWAVFGELTRRFLEGKLELTAGLRHFSDTVGQVHESNFGNAPTNPATLAPNVEDEFTKTTPRLILNWRPREQMTVYASYAEGFRSGLQQAPAVRLGIPNASLTKPDLLTNYEIGAKGTVWNGRVEYETAVYYMDWQEVQLPLTVFVNGLGFGMLINGASASGIGTDAAVTFHPFETFELGFNLSWNDLTVDEDVYSGGVLLFEQGKRLNSSIKTTAGAFANYRFPIGGSGLEGSFRVSANGRTPLESRFVTGSTVAVSKGDSIVTGRAEFTLISSKGWSAGLFIDNLNNERDVSMEFPSPAGIDGYYIRPRTYGLQLEYHL